MTKNRLYCGENLEILPTMEKKTVVCALHGRQTGAHRP